MTSVGPIIASLRTDQGRVRDHNEDFIAFHEPTGPDEEVQNGWLYIVADGVGGAEAGEVASQFATERTIHHYLADREAADLGERLRSAMLTANSELRDLVTDSESGSRMATTMVAAVIHNQTATIANVGDSRGYLWRHGVLRQITKDQSLVARLLEEGAITAEEALHHPRKNVILHSLGSEASPEIDLFQVELNAGLQLLLCSDGLTRHVSDEEIAQTIGRERPEQAAVTLIRLANQRGGEDNISVAILSFGEQPGWAAVRPADKQVTLARRRAPAALAPAERRALWILTAILCLVQTILIVLIWLWV
jgi:PPM family protein phosphatase